MWLPSLGMALKRNTSLSRTPLKRKTGNLSTKAKKPLKRAKKAWKFKKTELTECDAAFAREIRERDGRCMYKAGTYSCPATENLTCSHYIGRSNWNTRFDAENCLAICIRHHFMDRDTAYEFQKAREEKHGWDGRYTIRMREWLGIDRWKALLTRSEGNKTRKEAILETQKRYNLRQPVDNGTEDTLPVE